MLEEVEIQGRVSHGVCTNLDVAKDVVLDGGEGDGAQGVYGMLVEGWRDVA